VLDRICRRSRSPSLVIGFSRCYRCHDPHSVCREKSRNYHRRSLVPTQALYMRVTRETHRRQSSVVAAAAGYTGFYGRLGVHEGPYTRPRNICKTTWTPFLTNVNYNAYCHATIARVAAGAFSTRYKPGNRVVGPLSE